jgi:anti-anti-sigma factor
MPLYSIPVAIAYQLEDDLQGIQYGIGIQAVGTSAQAAQAISLVLVKALIAMRHPGKQAKLLLDRLKIGQPGPQIDGPYAYVFTCGNHINQLVFPARIDQDRGTHLEAGLAGLDGTTTLGVLVDCIHLAYINSTGLAAFAAHAGRLNMRLFRVSDPIAKVFEITGLTRTVPAYQDLPSALAALVRESNLSRIDLQLTSGMR